MEPRFHVTCAPFMLDGVYLKYVETVQYLSIVVIAVKSFKCSMERISIYKIFFVFLIPYMQKQVALILSRLQLN